MLKNISYEASRSDEFAQLITNREKKFILAATLYTALFIAGSFIASYFGITILKTIFNKRDFVRILQTASLISFPLEIFLGIKVGSKHVSALHTQGRMDDSIIYQVSTLCLLRSISVASVIGWCDVANLSYIIYPSMIQASLIFACFAVIGLFTNHTFINYVSMIFFIAMMSELASVALNFLGIGFFLSKFHRIISIILICTSGMFISQEVVNLRRYYRNHGANNLVAFLSGYTMFDTFVFIFIRLILMNLRLNKRKD